MKKSIIRHNERQPNCGSREHQAAGTRSFRLPSAGKHNDPTTARNASVPGPPATPTRCLTPFQKRLSRRPRSATDLAGLAFLAVRHAIAIAPSSFLPSFLPSRPLLSKENVTSLSPFLSFPATHVEKRKPKTKQNNTQRSHSTRVIRRGRPSKAGGGALKPSPLTATPHHRTPTNTYITFATDPFSFAQAGARRKNPQDQRAQAKARRCTENSRRPALPRPSSSICNYASPSAISRPQTTRQSCND